MLSIFREEPDTDAEGKTIPGPVSARRVLAFILAVAAIGLFAAAFLFSANGWTVFVPGIACLAGTLLLLFFTTWGDIAAIAAAWKGIK
jgi:hypothetical protein